MNTKVKKWGNSLAIRLPEEIAKKSELSEDSLVTLKLQAGVIKIKALGHKKTLKDMVETITNENRHQEFNLGKRVGREQI